MPHGVERGPMRKLGTTEGEITSINLRNCGTKFKYFHADGSLKQTTNPAYGYYPGWALLGTLFGLLVRVGHLLITDRSRSKSQAAEEIENLEIGSKISKGRDGALFS